MFHDPAQFPFIRAFQERWRLIRQEYRELDAPVLALHRAGNIELYVETLLRENGWTPSWQVDSDQPNHQWLTYGLSYKGLVPDGADRKLPATTRLLRRATGVHVAAFSLMKPASFLLPHALPDLAGKYLTLHLGLEVEPRRNYLCVEGEMREERNGQAIVFDGSREHFAINMGSADSVVLYLEFDPETAAVSGEPALEAVR